MERHFEKELDSLNRRIIEMGSKAENMIRLAMQSLVERKPQIAEAVDALEHEVNLMHIEIDDRSLALLATQQPMAMDLRFLVTGMKINSELERVGDQAVNIAQHAQTIIQYPMLKPLIDLPVMADLAKKMVRESLDAFVKRDPIEAESVIMQDDRVDGLKNQIFRELLTYMMSEPADHPHRPAAHPGLPQPGADRRPGGQHRGGRHIHGPRQGRPAPQGGEGRAAGAGSGGRRPDGVMAAGGLLEANGGRPAGSGH